MKLLFDKKLTIELETVRQERKAKRDLNIAQEFTTVYLQTLLHLYNILTIAVPFRSWFTFSSRWAHWARFTLVTKTLNIIWRLANRNIIYEADNESVFGSILKAYARKNTEHNIWSQT